MRRYFFALGTLMFAATAAARVADLSVTQSGPAGPGIEGGSITFSVVVSNRGPDEASVILFSEVLASNLTLESVDASPEWSCTAPAAGGAARISCSASSLSSGYESLIAFHARPTKAGLASGLASVAGTDTDPDPGNNSVTQNAAILPADSAAAGAGVAAPPLAGVPVTPARRRSVSWRARGR